MTEHPSSTPSRDSDTVHELVGLTVRQVIAADIANESDGYLCRYTGGFWGPLNSSNSRWRTGDNCVGTPTIKALLRLGVVEEIRRRGGEQGYPVLVRFKESYRAKSNIGICLKNPRNPLETNKPELADKDGKG